MNTKLIELVAESRDAALVVSLVFNAIMIGALWRLWKGYQQLIGQAARIYGELARELARLTERLLDKRT